MQRPKYEFYDKKLRKRYLNYGYAFFFFAIVGLIVAFLLKFAYVGFACGAIAIVMAILQTRTKSKDKKMKRRFEGQA